MTLLKPCAQCGELSERAWCEAHRAKDNRGKNRRDAGYSAAWDKLSARARKAQPFCTDCGSTEDLTCDHTPEAWARLDRGQTIDFRHVVVLCRRCNSTRGAARGERSTR